MRTRASRAGDSSLRQQLTFRLGQNLPHGQCYEASSTSKGKTLRGLGWVMHLSMPDSRREGRLDEWQSNAHSHHHVSVVFAASVSWASHGNPRLTSRGVCARVRAAITIRSRPQDRQHDRVGKQLGTNESLSMEHTCLVVRYLAKVVLT